MNWREAARCNQQKTRVVIVAFVLLYLVMAWVCVLLLHGFPAPAFWLPLLYQPTNQYLILAFMAVASVVVLSAVWFGGRIALAGTSYTQVTSEAQAIEYRRLYHVVEELSIAARLSIPKVYVIDSQEMNSFSAGYRDKEAFVAITQSLLAHLSREELASVVAHELSHIKQQDTQLLTLVSVMAFWLVLLVDLLFKKVLFAKHQRKECTSLVIFVLMLLRFVIPFLTSFLVIYVSDKRELLADCGAVSITRNPEALRSALRKIAKWNAQVKQTKNVILLNESMRSYLYQYQNHAKWSLGWFTAIGIEERIKKLSG